MGFPSYEENGNSGNDKNYRETRFLPRRIFFSAAGGLGVSFLTVGVYALESPNVPDKEGFFLTGHGIRMKRLVFAIDLYTIRHQMKVRPEKKSRAAIVEALCDKRFLLTMHRDLEAEKLPDDIRAGYENNGYRDAKKIKKLLSAFNPLKKGESVTFLYEARRKTTTAMVRGKSASVPGEEFMKATWNVWFGHVPDQPKLGDQLLQDL